MCAIPVNDEGVAIFYIELPLRCEYVADVFDAPLHYLQPRHNVLSYYSPDTLLQLLASIQINAVGVVIKISSCREIVK